MEPVCGLEDCWEEMEPEQGWGQAWLSSQAHSKSQAPCSVLCHVASLSSPSRKTRTPSTMTCPRVTQSVCYKLGVYLVF